MENFKNDVLPQLQKSFPCIEIAKVIDHEETIILRSSISTSQEVLRFLDSFSLLTFTNWNVKSGLKQPIRCVFSKRWCCQRSRRHKIDKNSARNSDCQAHISVLIKFVNRFTRRNDSYLKRTRPLPAVIKIGLRHNHSTSEVKSMKMLRVTSEGKQKYYNYFSDGLSLREALHLHEVKILMEENASVKLSNAHFNPTPKQVRHLHERWKKETLGITEHPLHRLHEKIAIYESTGAVLKIVENESLWAVLMVTPLMKRAQDLPSAAEVIFLDSTANVKSGVAFTSLLLPTYAGVIPIAILVHDCQKFDSYILAFTLLKEHFPNCFGGNEFPEIFMTDDATEEKNALSCIWPSSSQYLFNFYLSQTEWCWISAAPITVIPVVKKPYLMKLFQEVMNSETETELADSLTAIYAEKAKYTLFMQRFTEIIETKEEWIRFYKPQCLLKKREMFRFSEVTMRIIKDILLTRGRLFNVNALVEFSLVFFSDYFKSRLSDYTQDRKDSPRLLYESLKVEMSDSTEFTNVAENMYEIPSRSENKVYFVNTNAKLCTCKIAGFGALCKHLCLMLLIEDRTITTIPDCDQIVKDELYLLAMGPQSVKEEESQQSAKEEESQQSAREEESQQIVKVEEESLTEQCPPTLYLTTVTENYIVPNIILYYFINPLQQ